MAIDRISGFVLSRVQASLTCNLGRIYRVARSTAYAQQLTSALADLDPRLPTPKLDLGQAMDTAEFHLPAEMSRLQPCVEQNHELENLNVRLLRRPSLHPTLHSQRSKVLISDTLSKPVGQCMVQMTHHCALAIENFAKGSFTFDHYERQLKLAQIHMNLDMQEHYAELLPEERPALQWQKAYPIALRPLELALLHSKTHNAAQLSKGLDALKQQATFRGIRDISFMSLYGMR